MADFEFYTASYGGGSIPEGEFPRLAQRAEEQLARYKRDYTVTAVGTDSEELAVCAMADALYYFETVQNGGLTTSVSVGSVSSSSQVPTADLSPRGQAKELYRCARQYLEFYRGCG